MLSMISQPFNDEFSKSGVQAVDGVDEVLTFHDAIEPFTRLVLRSRKISSSTRLLCTVPTWNSAPDHLWDLHDLQELKSRFLLFIHEVIRSLRNAGVVATYSLVPSNSPQCLIAALPSNVRMNALVINEVERVRLPKSNTVSLVESQAGPCIVIN